MVLKFKKTLQEWIPFYVDAIKNRLRRDLNLSDVFDVQATRDNIGLSGINNHTHYHDDRYIPKIDKEVNTRKQEIANLTNSLNNKLTTEHNERIAADDKEKNERVTSINSIQAAFNKEITDLKKLCNDLKNRLDGNEFVKSKDNANNIALKYEQKDGESAKSLHAYLDGSEVPFTNNQYTDGYILIQAGVLRGGSYDLNNYIPNKYKYGYTYKFIISFKNTGGGDNHNTAIDIDTGIIRYTEHVDYFMYMIFAKKE